MFTVCSIASCYATHFTHHRLHTVDPNSWPLRSQPPSSHILGEVTHPCGDQCFLNNEIGEVCLLSFRLQGTYAMFASFQDKPSWDEADLDIFKTISEISPDATPCVLAELCLKPCNEVIPFL